MSEHLHSILFIPLKTSPPLGKVAAELLVLLTPLVDVVQALGCGLAVLGTEELLNALVELDAGDEAEDVVLNVRWV